MDHASIANVWFTIALVFIITLAAKVVRSRTLPAEKASETPASPEAKGVPLFGLLPAVLSRGLQAVIREQHSELGSVFTLRSLGLAVTLLVGPECCDHFFHAPDSEIGIDGVYEVTEPIFGKGVGYDIDLDTRNEQHSFFAKMLRPAKLRGHVHPMVGEVEEYFGKWGECGVVDLMQEVDHVLMLIASRCLLGKEVRDNMFDEVASLLHELIGGMHLISMFFPYLPTPGHRRSDKARARLGEIFSQIVRTRTMSGRAEDDMLQDLIDSRYGDGRATTGTEVTGLLVALLFAGHHTSSTVSVWTALRLLAHPEHLHAVMAEQERLVAEQQQQQHGNNGSGDGGGVIVDYGVLLQMDVLHRCIKEALRLHPVTQMILRRARQGFTVRAKEGGEYSVPAGRLLASPPVVNNLLPNIYNDPHVFDPDRFTGRVENKAGASARNELAYLGFGAGKHACMREGYAYQQIKVVLSHLLRNFELKLESSFPERENMLSMRPKGKVMVVSYKIRKLLCNM